MSNTSETSPLSDRGIFLRASILGVGALALAACTTPQPELPPKHEFGIPPNAEKLLSFFDRADDLLCGGTVLFMGTTREGIVTAGSGILLRDNGVLSVATIAHVAHGIKEATGKMAMYIPHIGLAQGFPDRPTVIHSSQWSRDPIYSYKLPPKLTSQVETKISEKKILPIKLNTKQSAIGQFVAIPNVYGGSWSTYRVVGNDDNQLLRLAHVKGPLLCQGNSGAPVLQARFNEQGDLITTDRMFGMLTGGDMTQAVTEIKGAGLTVQCSPGIYIQPHNKSS